MSRRVVKVAVINDLICSSCYVAHEELLLAIAQCSDVPITIEVEYRPFCLPTCIPDDAPVSTKSFYLAKYGREKTEVIHNAAIAWGNKIGLSLNFEDGVTSSTVRAHRLSVKAYRLGGQGLQLPLLSAILKACHTESKDISSIEVLSDIAESVGVMSKDAAVEFLEGDELKEEVINTAEAAKGHGVKGVPVTVINGKWALAGAQKAEVFVQIFKKLATTVDSAAPSPLQSPVMQPATTRVS